MNTKNEYKKSELLLKLKSLLDALNKNNNAILNKLEEIKYATKIIEDIKGFCEKDEASIQRPVIANSQNKITTPAPNDIQPIKEAIDRFKFQIYKVEFESWYNKNNLDREYEYFTRHEVRWLAEQTWIAAIDLCLNKNKENHNDSTII